MHRKTGELFTFGDFSLEILERRLLRRGEPVSLPPKVFDLLALLVTNHGRLLEKEQILKSVWPGTFVEDSNLSVNVSALRKVLGDDVAGARFIETVPKRGYRFVSPVTEVTPVRPAPPGPPPPDPPPARRHRRTLVAATALLAALAGALFWYTRRTEPPRSLAVLPFLPLGGGAADPSVGLGIADSVITRISALQRIDIVPTNSVLKFGNGEHDAIAAGRELDVDAVLVGRVQHSDQRIRVTTQLVRVRDGKQLWAGTFDDTFNNIFEVQDAIAERVATALSLRLSEAEQKTMSRRATVNAEAYRYYVQGRYMASRRLQEATQHAIEAYEKAVYIDPEYAPAYASLATSYLMRAGEGFNPTLREKAKTAALKAIILDEQLSEAHVALAQVLMRSEWDWAGAERAFRRSVALDANSAAAHAGLATLLTAYGRHDEALTEMKLACRLDPGSVMWLSDLSWSFAFARRYDDALTEARRAIDLDSWSYSARRQLGKAYLLKGDFSASIQEAQKSLEINSGRRRRVLAEIAKADAASGQTAEARKLLQQISSGDWQEPEPFYELAVLHAALGNRDSALRALSSAVDARFTRVIWMKVDPELDPIRNDRRFAALLGTLKLPD